MLVEDSRLPVLSELSESKKIIQASVSIVDIAGIVKGASKGEGLGNKFLTHIREADAIIQVVRCFDDPNVIHVAGAIDPLEDIHVIGLELILADLQMAENIVSKAKGKKEMEPTIVWLKRAIEHLNQSLSLRTMQLTKEELVFASQYPFLTRKQVLYVCNVGEADLPSMENVYVKRVREYATKEGSIVVPICARLEEELVQLDEKDAKEYLQSLGLKESGLSRLVRSAYELLGLITFITTGEIETRAWTIRRGATAAEAAGKIHSDIQKGFIRAEVVSYEDMVQYGSRPAARDAGRARSEGRDYIVKDGDVILFYHN